ncbi:MAG: hypothetical protein ACE37M_11185 [Henriciella sp.]
MQTTEFETPNPAPSYWLRGMPALLANGLCGLIAIFVAIAAMTYEPHSGPGGVGFDHIVRIISFAGLTIWVTFTIGISRRGAAAMIVLGFAVFLELVIVPLRESGLSTIASANLGIVLAYCVVQMYWFALQARSKRDRLHLEPAKD